MSVYYMDITLELREEAIFSKNLSPGNIYYCFDYIPGSVLWGMFATRFPKDGMELFYQTFFSNKIVFTNLYPLTRDNIPTLPLPLSTFACKRKPGFDESIVDEQKHSFWDYLLNDRGIEKRCPYCKSKKKSFSDGFYCKKGENYYSYNVSKTVDMHNLIDDELQSTRKDALYSYEVLNKGQKFKGHMLLYGEWNQFDEIHKLIESINHQSIWIGKGRNNGYGLSFIHFTGDKNYSLENKRLYANGEINLSKEKNKFTLTLILDTFLLDKYANYLTYIDEAVLFNILGSGFSPESFKLLRSFSRVREVDGFNMKHNLPKNKMIAIRKGSAFYFEYKGSEYEKLTKRLLEIERNGIGVRKNEGYGQVVINLPYHREKQDGTN